MLSASISTMYQANHWRVQTLQQRAVSCTYRLQARQLVVRTQAAQTVSELPGSMKKLVMAFQAVPDPMARYKQLLFFANKLEALPAEDHVPANKVEGCVSQVWVVPELRADGKVYWRADSDSQLTKGLAALLVQGLSGCTPAEILAVDAGFIELLGLKQSLTPSRNNGFLNMFKLMQKKSLQVMAAQAQEAGQQESSPAAETVTAPSSSAPAPAPASSSSTPIADAIHTKLSTALSPRRISVEDQSAQHAGHAAMRAAHPGKAGGTAETHFRVEVVSDVFEGKTLVARHRLINQLLAPEFGAGLHALSLDTKTPAEAMAATRT